MSKRGPRSQIGYHKVFNLILQLLYTGMPWKQQPIPQEPPGKPVIHYTGLYKPYARWAEDDSLAKAFTGSVKYLGEQEKLDQPLLHGDGSNIVAKRGRRHRLLGPQVGIEF
ncbi:hypothetical protein Mmc1_0603 [Magnetococcus marinus MC-1]|uniref:Transposase n=1 Tax=Magnetococcus marinus (strain ATCC BAA-1437 / JCM 17883 / MC-1) TaxID=156889 RepID=A0L581_MAGMM|nr:hypothetical protein [Magnetococcus marinus]ABK43124.1 hypothetical protein Mmc1_0603 [Magnetococcus marinus MC-1]